jgi:hypothetical protein
MKQAVHHLPFKFRYDLEERKEKFTKYNQEEPDKIPIIV